MKIALPSGMREALRLTKAGSLTHATALIQRLLGGRGEPDRSGHAEIEAEADGTGGSSRATGVKAGDMGPPSGHAASGQTSAPWPAVNELRGMFDKVGRADFWRQDTDPHPVEAAATEQGQARFLTASFSNQAGSRPYKLFVPSGYQSRVPAPLVVMLHGCTQSPDDFATGTRMNDAAERHSFLVAYPAQITSANPRKCWNWFNVKDQRRDGGEPSLIAGITLQVMRDYAIDPGRVYVAGLSAGGAAAAIMGEVYPDLYAAIGVHSGLAFGAARDVHSALAAMKSGKTGLGPDADGRWRSNFRRTIVPAIVFHGDRDTTVNPRNGDAVAAQFTGDTVLRLRTEIGQVPGGHAYSRIVHSDPNGHSVAEQWVVHGGGHAWFGGSSGGSFTDPSGPDATAEMLRFFLEHPREEDALATAHASNGPA